VLGIGFAADVFGLKPAVAVFTVILGVGSVVIAWFSRRCEPEAAAPKAAVGRLDQPLGHEVATDTCG
jgi:hypothetical protein